MTSLGELLRNNEWDGARKVLERVTKLEDVQSALQTVVADPSLPLDIVSTLFFKLRAHRGKLARKLPHSYGLLEGDFDNHMWNRVCRCEGATRRPDWGRVCRFGSVQTIQFLLKQMAAFDGAWPSRQRVRSTVCYLWRSHLVPDPDNKLQERQFRPRLVAAASKEKQEALTSVSSFVELQKFPDVRGLWEKTEILLKAASQHYVNGNAEDSNREWLAVHEIIEAGFPSVVVWLSMRLFPSQIRKRDRYGRLPLHCASAKTYKDLLQVSFSGKLSQLNKPVLELVAERYPDAARFQDLEGRLPLHYELERGRNSLIQRVSFLVKAAPRALITRDFKSHLLPFMVAASNNVSFDIVYLLLLKDPSAVSRAVVDTAYESYLKKKLLASESLRADLEIELSVLREENRLLKKELQQNMEVGSSGKHAMLEIPAITPSPRKKSRMS